MRNLLTVTSILALLATLTGCGMIPFKESTNKKAVGGMSNSHQASFELRDERKRTADNKDCNPKKHKDVLVFLSLSGGGSRAALLSGLSMIEMQDIRHSKIGDAQDNNSIQNNNGIDVLSEVDLISSVSGGSLAAGYYAISDDDPDNPKTDSKCSGDSGRKWSKKEVATQMSNNYLGRWIGNWFWPDNILLYWLTTYDRTDIMAQTFADNLFDTNWVGKDLSISMLNPARPNIVINATQGSENAKYTNGFGQPFTFTREDFYNHVCSQIDDYELSRAVMASAAFPGVFNFMTLRNYCNEPKKTYVHLFDGGNSDNLGLTSIKRAIWNLSNEGNDLENSKLASFRKILVIQIDAYTNSNGVSNMANDPRQWTDFIMDVSSVVTSSDSLLAKNRNNLLTQFKTSNLFPYMVEPGSKTEMAVLEKKKKEIADECVDFFSWKPKEEAGNICASTNWDAVKKFFDSNKRLHFVHVNFEGIADNALKHQLNNIATNFKLDTDRDSTTNLTAKEAIECAVPLLFGKIDYACKYRGANNEPLTPSNESIRKWNDVYEIINQ